MPTELKNANVLSSGGHGFLGSHVVDVLERRGATGIVTPRSAEFDLTDAAATHRLFERECPDVVLAAKVVGGIGANCHSVREFLELAFGHAGLDWRKVDPKHFRPTEVGLLKLPKRERREAA